VTAYPIPDDPILLHDRERSIIKTDTNRIDVLLAFQLLEFASRDAQDCSGTADRLV
jgi:hypothetical protein